MQLQSSSRGLKILKGYHFDAYGVFRLWSLVPYPALCDDPSSWGFPMSLRIVCIMPVARLNNKGYVIKPDSTDKGQWGR